ncbi:MAG: hypothetical protein HC772_07620 [Leptolyngbyaceae cyanobacterium CRU_2_3]|nr:hypothetical protein [Leptolyngbyaceae cyanobacterium CRU_2_3]
MRAQAWQRWIWLMLSGLNFGASAAIKWNGLGFLLGAGLVWVAAWLLHWLRLNRAGEVSDHSPNLPLNLPSSPRTPLHNLTQLHIGHVLFCWVAIPALTYYVSWLPYLHVDQSGQDFWDLQTTTLDYHKRVGGLNAHPYCSLWFTWPLMLRPIAYFYKTSRSVSELPPVVGPPLPTHVGSVIYDVHAMGNPLLWWFSTAAIVLLFGLLIQQAWQGLTVGKSANPAPNSLPRLNISGLNTYSWIMLYLGLNWAANLLPWLRVTRCAFLYHYMESLVFAILALALLVDRWLQSPLRPRRQLGWAILAVVLLAFAFWMPLYLGLPLSPIELQLRRWLPSWI